jgi:hypothetical protein
MIEQLFGSKTRVKLLKLFYQNPNRSYYVREITRKIEEQINSVRRELANLLSMGIIGSDTTNNKLYYEVNQKYEHYNALSSIFAGKKFKTAKKSPAKDEKDIEEAKPKVSEEAFVESDPFIDELVKSGNVSIALYTGQFTRDDTSGVDVLIVGDVNGSLVDKLVFDLEQSEKKQIRYVVMDPDEYKYRKQINDRFVSNIGLSKKIVFINKNSLL